MEVLERVETRDVFNYKKDKKLVRFKNGLSPETL